MTETWEFEPHAFDDDGFEAKCFGGQTETSAPAELIASGRGFAVCPECGVRVSVVSING